MKNGFSVVAVLCVSLLSAACARIDSSCMTLPEGGRYCLQNTAEIPAFEVQQKIDFYFKEKRETMIAQLEVNGQGMYIVGLTPLGQKLVQAGYDNESVKAALLPGIRLDPVFLLGMVQLSLWPAETIERGLNDSCRVEDDGVQRRIMINGIIIMKIDYIVGSSPDRDMNIEFPALEMKLQISHLEQVDVSTQPVHR